MGIKRRLQYIDVARGFGIFLVVLGHTYRGNVVQNWLYSFHMPLFFFISGWLYENKINYKKDFFSFVLKKSRSLIVPYIDFLVFNFLYWILVERHFRTFDQGPLWFLPVLFIVECVVAIIVNWFVKTKTQSALILAVLLLGFICIDKVGIESECVIVGYFIRCYNAIIWYYMGYMLSQRYKNRIKSFTAREFSCYFFVLMSFLLNMLLGCSNGRVDMFTNRFNNIYLYVLAALFGIFFCIGISFFIGKNKALEYLGKNSLIIMCTHEPIKRAVIQVVSFVLHVSSDEIRNNIMMGFMLAILVICIEIIVIKILYLASKTTRGKKIHVLFEYI